MREDTRHCPRVFKGKEILGIKYTVVGRLTSDTVQCNNPTQEDRDMNVTNSIEAILDDYCEVTRIEDAAEKCIASLLDDSKEVAEKVAIVNDYVRRESTRISEKEAFEKLFEAFPSDPEAREKVEQACYAIRDHNKSERKARLKPTVDKLRSLQSGTLVVIRNQSDHEQTVKFMEIKRTRFICEFNNGRQYSTPVSRFIRIHNESVVA